MLKNKILKLLINFIDKKVKQQSPEIESLKAEIEKLEGDLKTLKSKSKWRRYGDIYPQNKPK